MNGNVVVPGDGLPKSWRVLSPAGRVLAITYTQPEAETCAAALGWKAPAPQPPAEAQAQVGGEVVAKSIEWMEDGPGEWCDRHHGFHITQDDEEPQENRFMAAWGEADTESFPTLEEAQAWCQEAIDDYIRRWVRTAHPSAPVGVPKVAVPADVMEARAQGRAEALAIVLGLEAETGLDDYIQSIPPGPAGEWGTAWDEAKLRELFRADDTAWSLLQEAEGEYWHNLGLREEAQHLAQQPAAVGEAADHIAALRELYATRNPVGRFARAIKAGIAALAAKPGGDRG